MSAEETENRFLRAAAAAQFHKSGSFEPILWNSVIVTMRLSAGALKRAAERARGLDKIAQTPLHLHKAILP